MGWDLIIEFLNEVWQKKSISESDARPIRRDVLEYFSFPEAYDAFVYTITLYKGFGFTTRKNGDPWPIHELEVAKLLSDVYASKETVLVGFNHDKPEDIFKKRMKKLDECLRVLVIPDLDETTRSACSKSITSLRNIIYKEDNNPEIKNITSLFGSTVADVVTLLSNGYYLFPQQVLYSEGNLGYMKSDEAYISYIERIGYESELYNFMPIEGKLADSINHLKNIDGIDHDVVFRAIQKTSYVINAAYNLQLSYGTLPHSTQSLLSIAEDTLKDVRACNIVDLPKNKKKLDDANERTDYILDHLQRIKVE